MQNFSMQCQFYIIVHHLFALLISSIIVRLVWYLPFVATNCKTVQMCTAIMLVPGTQAMEGVNATVGTYVVC